MMSREELYKRVWSQPMTKIGKELGVSGSYLARICSLLNVPRPERGYWAKLAVGKAPAQPPLPEARPGDQLQWSKEGEVITRPRPETPHRRKPEQKMRIARDQVHTLIRGARTHFEKGRDVEDGAYLKPFKKLLVDVTASATGLNKALEIANDLFNELTSLGHRVVIAPADVDLGRAPIEEREVADKQRDHWQRGLWSPYRPTVVYVGTVAVGLAIVEISEKVILRYLNGKYIRAAELQGGSRRYDHLHSWTTTRDLPSGRFRIIAYSPYRAVSHTLNWDEAKSASLRPRIKAIAESIEQAATDLVPKIEEAERQAEIRHQEWLAQQERWRREEDRRNVEKSVTESKNELQAIIERYSAIVSVEQFFAGVELRANHLSEPDKGYVLDRVTTARAFLGSQDPLDFFKTWRAPEERYVTKYPEE